MVGIDTCLHLIGFELLAVIVIVRYDSKNPKQLRLLKKALAVLLCIMFGHAVTHILPEKIARFVYSSHHGFSTHKNLT